MPPELALGQLERMRPILSIFLGGTGQMIGAFLKARLNTRFGPAWQQKFRLLAFDTTEEPLTVQVDGASISLEPEAEFFHIGHVPVPRIMRNIRNLESVEKRLGSILPRLPASVMRGNGAKSVRPLALLALYWHFETVYAQLRQAIWDLAGRELSTADIALQQQGINVVIASSLVGGTGSGLFLDIAYLVRHLFNELGELGQFCHITGMGVLPQAFHGIQAANLHANAGAALEELNHLMSYGNFEAHYPGGHVVHVQEAPFNLYHVLDGVDERGQTWAGILDVSEMAAESIFLQMASQLGRKGENAFDNLDEILIERTAEGDINAFSSVGLGALEFPAPQVATLCANRLLQKTAQESWLAAPSDVLTARIVAEKLQPVMGSDLNRELQRDPDGGVMQIDLPSLVGCGAKHMIKSQEPPPPTSRSMGRHALTRQSCGTSSRTNVVCPRSRCRHGPNGSMTNFSPLTQASHSCRPCWPRRRHSCRPGKRKAVPNWPHWIGNWRAIPSR